MGQRISSGLERLLKKAHLGRYVPPIAITYFNTPLHEGLHAVTAKALPSVSCNGISLNTNLWYSGVLEKITAGFVSAKELGSNIAGNANLTYEPTFLGKIGISISSAVPEIAAMTLGFYWLKTAIDSISESGKRIYSLVTAFCGMSLASGSFYYLKQSSLSPAMGEDHCNFTTYLLDAMHIPQSVGQYATVLGAATMVAASLYLAKMLTERSSASSST